MRALLEYCHAPYTVWRVQCEAIAGDALNHGPILKDMFSLGVKSVVTEGLRNKFRSTS